MARLLFREFLEILNSLGTEDLEVFGVRTDNFLKHYKMCDDAIQGEFHEIVSDYMKDI